MARPLSPYPVPRPKRFSKGAKRRGTPNTFRREASLEAAKLIPETSQTLAAGEAGKYYECFEAREAYDPTRKEIVEHPIIDRSLTARQMLRLRYQTPLTGITLRNRQLDHKTGQMAHGSDPKILTRSPKSLLNLGKPGTLPILKRETSGSKRIRVDADAPIRLARHLQDPADRPQPGIELDFDAPTPTGKGKRTNGKLFKTNP